MNSFVTIKSILLVFTLYFSFIFNNSFVQFLQSQVLLSTFLLIFVIAELISFGYKFVFSHGSELQVYSANLLLSVLLLLYFPFLLDYFFVFVALFLYEFFINFLSPYFTVEDFSSTLWSSHDKTEAYIYVAEERGLFYSYYSLRLQLPLSFLSLDDKRQCFDLIRNNDGTLDYSVSHGYYFSFYARGCKFFATTRNRVISLALDIAKMNNNFNNIQ